MDVLVGRLRAAGCVFAEEEAAVLVEQAGSASELEAMVAQRVQGRPLELIVGWAGFRGARTQVSPGVFVPRRRTEFLVELAVPLLAPGRTAVDLCCGTGAVGAARTSVCIWFSSPTARSPRRRGPAVLKLNVHGVMRMKSPSFVIAAQPP